MINAGQRRAVVRGSGSIGVRHAAVLRGLGLTVDIWPVRPRTAVQDGYLPDRQRPVSYAGADLVVVATDTGRHVNDAIEALDQGAQRVLVEKPVAPTADEATLLASHSRSAAVSVAVPLRAHLGFKTVLAALEHLRGRLAVSLCCQSWLPDWRHGTDYRQSYAARPHEGGVLRDLIHEIDYALALFGPPEVAGAILDYDGPLDMPTEQAATAVWATDRATVNMRLDYVTRPSCRLLEVRSPTGSLEWNLLTGQVTTTDADGTSVVIDHDSDRDRNAVMGRQAQSILNHEDLGSVAWLTRLSEGAPATLEEAIAAVAICDEMRRIDSIRRHG